MNFIEWLKKKQQEEKQKQQQQQQQEAAAYDKIMSTGAGSEKYKAKKQVQQQNAQIKTKNDAIKKSNEKLQSDLAAEADKQGMNANQKMYYTQTQYMQRENKTKVPYKTMRDYRSNQIDFVDKDLGEIMKNDPEAQKKIEAGNALNVYLNGGQTYDESIALGEGWKDTYMTQFRDSLSPEELKKLSYLLGEQQLNKTDHAQTIKDYTKTIEYRAGQAHEDKKYASGDYKTGNFYANSAAQGAVAGTIGGFNKLIKRLTGDITPTVMLAEEKAYQKELSEAEGFKRIAGLTINSAAQMATSGGTPGMFMSVAGNTYDQSRKQGYNDSESLTYALINAGMETVTTKLGGKLFGGYKGFVKGVPELKETISKVVKNPIAQRCAFLITDMGAEGVEETLQTAVDPLIRNTVFKENNNLVLSGKDYLESFLVGSLSVGALHAKSVAVGINTDVKTMNMDIKLPDGTYVGADTINRYFNGQATESDVKQIKQLGSSINEENMNGVLKRMDDIANVKMGKETYGEMNKKTAGMSAYDKISYFSDVMSSPEFKAHTEELMKTAQEQKAKAENISKGEAADVSDIRQNAEAGILNSTKNSIQEGNSVEVNNTENTQDKTTSMNENVGIDKVSNENTETNNVFNKGTVDTNNNNQGIDTDNDLKENGSESNAIKKSDNEGNVISSKESKNDIANGENDFANSDELGYKVEEGKKNSEINKNIDQGLEHYNKILSYEPQITEFITDMASKLSMNVEGLEYRIKSKDSYLRKLTSNKSIDKIRDIIRYTFSTSPDTLTDKILESIEVFKNKGYTTINIYNTWNYEFYPYKGINTVVKTPDGIVFELQYHTPESYKLKNGELHKLYEKQRLLEDTSSDEYIELNNKMIELSNILTKPIGIERIISQ